MKKLFVLSLAVLMVLGIFCGCKPQNTEDISSQITSRDTTSSSNTVILSKVESGVTILSRESSNKSSSDNPSSTSSVKTSFTETSSVNLNPDVKETDVPLEEIVKYLFDKSTDYIASFCCAEILDAVRDGFGVKVDEHTFYDSEGHLLDSYKSPCYYKSNRTYEDAKAHYAETFTGDMLNEFMDAYFVDFNGTLGIRVGGGATGITYDNLTLEYQGYENGIHNYIAHYNFCEFNADINDNGRYPKQTAFAITLSDDGYRVCENEYNGGISHW